MIEHGGIRLGDLVLEIGTGTGYSTALLRNVLGDHNVTSVEVDQHAADRARKALAEGGRVPALITGDGLLGAPGGAPYDRLIAACSVRYVPYTVGAEGEATGHFLPGHTSFMIARSHDHPPRGTIDFMPGEQRPSRIDPALLDDWSGRFVAQLAAPSAERLGAGAEQVLLDVATGSQARTRPAERGGWSVAQRGPLKLWDAVEDAVEAWQAAGSPHLSAFGLTIAREGQRVWLGSPDGPGWLLPVRGSTAAVRSDAAGSTRR